MSRIKTSRVSFSGTNFNWSKTWWNWDGGKGMKIKTPYPQNHSLLNLQLGGRGYASVEWAKLLKKMPWEKFGMLGQNKKREEDSPSLPSIGESQAGMTATDPCSPSWLTECGRRNQLNSNLFKKDAVRKKLEWWGTIKTSGKLTVDAFCRQVARGDGVDGPLLP